MLATNNINDIKDFDNICDRVVQNCKPIIITRSNDENVVIISQAEYSNLLENIYVRKNKNNYERLLESIEQAKQGKLVTSNLEDYND